jgi:hypothetical protein
MSELITQNYPEPSQQSGEAVPWEQLSNQQSGTNFTRINSATFNQLQWDPRKLTCRFKIHSRQRQGWSGFNMCPWWGQESALPLGNVSAAGWRCQWQRCVGQRWLREAVGWREVWVRFPPRRLHGRWRGGGPGGNRHGEGSVRGILIVRGSTVRSREEIHREPGFQVFPASKTAGVLGKLIAAATDNGFFFFTFINLNVTGTKVKWRRFNIAEVGVWFLGTNFLFYYILVSKLITTEIKIK